MTYKIKNYSYKKAKELNVEIKPSKKKNKKIDVYKNDVLIASVGDTRYLDYPSYLEKAGNNLEKINNANLRRKLYKERHKKDLSKGNGFYANKLLW
jgi:hypothetical protein